MTNKDNQTPGKRKFVSYLLKRDPKLKPAEIPPLLNEIKRFVQVVHKIYTEPQAQISLKDVVIDGKIVHQRVIEGDLEELSKVFDKSKTQQDALDVMRKFHKEVTKDKYGRK